MRPTMLDFPMPIVTPRILMRQPIMNYVDAYEYTNAVMESINELQPWMPWAQYYPTAEQSEEYIRECCAGWIMKNNNNVGLPLWIIERATGKFIGHIVMHNIAWDALKFEFGYWLRTPYIGRGFISEAVNALTRYCFLQIRAQRVEVRCEIRNTRSAKVPKRLGFDFDGTLHNNQLAVATGEITDTLVFSRKNLNGLPELDVRWGAEA